MSGRGSGSIRAGVADGPEDRLPAFGSVTPVVRLEDQDSLRAVSDHEAVNHVMELTAVSTAFIDVTHQLTSFTAVLWVLSHKPHTQLHLALHLNYMNLYQYSMCT